MTTKTFSKNHAKDLKLKLMLSKHWRMRSSITSFLFVTDVNKKSSPTRSKPNVFQQKLRPLAKQFHHRIHLTNKWPSNKQDLKSDWHWSFVHGIYTCVRAGVGNRFWVKSHQIWWRVVRGPQINDQRMLGNKLSSRRMAGGPSTLDFPLSSWAYQRPPFGPHVSLGPSMADPCFRKSHWE